MSTDRFRTLFFEEAREQLQALEAGLMDLEARRDDRAHLDRTFRAAHTLKGAAGMFGLPAVAKFTHGVEAVLDRIRSGTLEPVHGIITLLLAAKDHLASAIDAEDAGRVAPEAAEMAAQLTAVVEGRFSSPAAAAQPGEPELAPAEDRAYRITLAPDRDAFRRGINPLGMLDELKELGEAQITAHCDRVPPLEDLDPSECRLAWTIDLRTGASLARLREVFLFLDAPGQFSIALRDAAESPDTEPDGTVAPAAAAPLKASSARIRVEADQLDELVGMTGELAILSDSLQGLAARDGAGPWAGALEALDRLGGRLRDATLELRMVPVEELFDRFPRVVRDLAERTGKQVALRVEGEETRLDRAIIERLAEPILHLIRNAVDHGLEPPSERVAAGKPAAGLVTISAGHEGDRVAIRVSDDGRGLDRARIARKGIALGLLAPETPVDDPRVVNLVFEPGFSTREQAGELSGRGVGLDVVRDTIRALQGSVTLRSVEGQGTTFLIRLPLTLAMIDGLLVEVGAGRFIVPMGQVDECVAPAADELVTTLGRLAAVVRGELVPIVSLGGSARTELLLTRYAEQRVAVAVDRLVGRVQAVIQPLDEELDRLRRYSGATILGDGSVCLILDLPSLISAARAAEHAAAATMSSSS